MAVDILTKEDLLEFKEQFFTELKTVLQVKEAPPPVKRWLRSHEVRKLLNVSTGTLQNLRIAGTLNPQKIGGIHFYDYEEICRVMQNANETNR